MNSEFLIPIAFFAMVYGIVYLLIRRKERLTLIEKGMDASIFDSKKNEPSSLKWGLLLVGFGVGILLGKVLAVYSCLDEEPAFFSMICLFGGIGLILFHIIARKFPEPPKNKE
jgi:hypothetical protein